MNNVYDGAWLDYGRTPIPDTYKKNVTAWGNIPDAAAYELEKAGMVPESFGGREFALKVGAADNDTRVDEGYYISVTDGGAYLNAANLNDFLYGMYRMLIKLRLGEIGEEKRAAKLPLRLMIHWDNGDGNIERGYAGKSLFFENNTITSDMTRMRDYARLLCSAGYNAIIINNTNVHEYETGFIFKENLPAIKKIYDVFMSYGIKLFLSVNFAAPYECGDTDGADPCDEKVCGWWREKAREIYDIMPQFGGFSVKADSEGRPGPFTYGRTHADGANMLARALKPFGGLLLWRCFVYNCTQDWRDTKTDRACAAYNVFKPLDGQFDDNVILQIKNGPMDFQIDEPISPLFGAMNHTKMLVEFQITQEYTGQQKHVCCLGDMWRDVLNFRTYAPNGADKVIDRVCGIGGISNVGDDSNWTGHKLAQANLYTMAQLAYSTENDTDREWAFLTFPKAGETVDKILKSSYGIYAGANAPLGIGWMVSPNHHYGPSPMGYEFDRWGTYNRADRNAVGVDRSSRGTGYAMQYTPYLAELYDNPATCPEKYLLFFHRLPYSYVMKSGKTLIQHIYDTHFASKAAAEKLPELWESIKNDIDATDYNSVLERLKIQARDTAEWCDVINSYFFRFSGVGDEQGRTIY